VSSAARGSEGATSAASPSGRELLAPQHTLAELHESHRAEVARTMHERDLQVREDGHSGGELALYMIDANPATQVCQACSPAPPTHPHTRTLSLRTVAEPLTPYCR
jgi:hypothetical protein